MFSTFQFKDFEKYYEIVREFPFSGNDGTFIQFSCGDVSIWSKPLEESTDHDGFNAVQLLSFVSCMQLMDWLCGPRTGIAIHSDFINA